MKECSVPPCGPKGQLGPLTLLRRCKRMIWRSNATPTPPHLRGLGRYSEEGRTRGVVNARGVGCTVGRMPYPNTTTLAGELRGVVIGRLNSVWVSAVRKEFQTSRKGAYRQDGEVKGVPKPLHLPP